MAGTKSLDRPTKRLTPETKKIHITADRLISDSARTITLNLLEMSRLVREKHGSIADSLKIFFSEGIPNPQGRLPRPNHWRSWSPPETWKLNSDNRLAVARKAVYITAQRMLTLTGPGRLGNQRRQYHHRRNHHLLPGRWSVYRRGRIQQSCSKPSSSRKNPDWSNPVNTMLPWEKVDGYTCPFVSWSRSTGAAKWWIGSAWAWKAVRSSACWAPTAREKTTTFYMTVGLIKPDGGQVFLDDMDITDYPMHIRAQNRGRAICPRKLPFSGN